MDKTIQNKQKEALGKSEAYLNSLVQSSSYYLVRTDLEGKYTYVNHSFCKQFGFDQKVIGQDSLPTIHPDDHETCKQAVVACLAEVGKVEKLVLRKPLPNGGFLHTAWEFVAVENGQGVLSEIQCVGRDMTEEREVFRQLEAEKQVRQLIRDNSRLGMWYWYFESDDHFVGDAQWSSILGYRDDKRLLTGKEWKTWLHPEDKTAFLLALSQHLNEETPHFSEECRIRCKNGTWKWVLIAGKVFQKEAYLPRKITGTMIDISTTKEPSQLSQEKIENLEYTKDAVIVTDLNHMVNYANQAAGDLFDCEIENFIGTDFSKLYPQEATQEEGILAITGKQYIAKEWKRKNKYGREVWIQMYFNLIRSADQQPVGFVGIARDVTATKENYETIRKTKEQYERLINSIDVIVWEYDWEKQVYRFISEHVKDFLGYPVESWYNIPNFWETILYEEDRAAIQARMHKQVAALQNYTTEYRAETIEGEMIWIEEVVTIVVEDGKPVRLQGIMVDITQRKALEIKIAHSEKKYKLLAENASDLVFIMNDDHRFQYVSPVVEKMYGYSVEEFLKFKWENLLSASSLLNARRHIEELEETSPQQDSIKMQLEQVRKEGNTFWTEVTLKIIYNNNGQCSGFIGTARDISEEVALEREIE
ncbi:MAG: PAS domain S-box protein [Bacteroidota bacterium]